MFLQTRRILLSLLFKWDKSYILLNIYFTSWLLLCLLLLLLNLLILSLLNWICYTILRSCFSYLCRLHFLLYFSKKILHSYINLCIFNWLRPKFWNWRWHSPPLRFFTFHFIHYNFFINNINLLFNVTLKCRHYNVLAI